MGKTVQLSLGLIFALIFLSCRGHPDTFREIDAGIEVGSFRQALQAIDRERSNSGSIHNRNAILFHLDRGMINHFAGFYADSSYDLQEAERLIEEAFTRSLSQEIATFIANDNAREYPGEDYEDLYINVFNALNYYHNNDIEGALVEIRRVNEKLTVLADKYERAIEMVASSTPDLAEDQYVIEAVRFSNSALARYLSLLFFRARGRADDVRIDLEELSRAYELAPDVYYHDPPSSIAEEQFIPPGMARLNIISFTGLSPIKEEAQTRIFMPLPPPNESALLALPRMVDRPSAIESIEVILNTGERFHLELLEDMNRVAHETFRARYSLIQGKTLARTIIKTTTGFAAGAAAGAATAHAARDHWWGDAAAGIVGFSTRLGARLAADASEQADLRISRFFPGRAHVGGINLKPGVYSITVNFYGRGGLIDTERHDNVLVQEDTLNLAQFVSLR